MRLLHLILLLPLLATVAQAEPAVDDTETRSHWRGRLEMGALFPTAPLDDVVSGGFLLGLGVGYQLDDHLGVGLHVRGSWHDYDELDGVPLGPGYYEPSWSHYSYAVFAEFSPFQGIARPYLGLHAGFQHDVLHYTVDQPGEDDSVWDSSPLVGLLSGALGVASGDDAHGDVRLEFRYETRPGHWDDATWSLALGFSLGRSS